MDIFIQQIINGLVLGSMYALVALGYTMVYGIINLINFAHGEVLMVGALVAWTVVTWLADSGMPGWALLLLALLVAMAACMLLNYVIEKLAYRPLRNAPRLAPLITAMGVSLLLLFMVSVALHSQMYRLRPEPDRLTGFYLAMAFGGALGGVFAGLVAPVVFDWTYEYPILIFAAGPRKVRPASTASTTTIAA